MYKNIQFEVGNRGMGTYNVVQFDGNNYDEVIQFCMDNNVNASAQMCYNRIVLWDAPLFGMTNITNGDYIFANDNKFLEFCDNNTFELYNTITNALEKM